MADVQPSFLRRLGGLPVWVWVAAALLALYLRAPWTLWIGGQFTPRGQWTAVGEIRPAGGASFGVMLHMQAQIPYATRGGAGLLHPTLDGTASLCTHGSRGEYLMHGALGNAWASTEGKAVVVRFYPAPPATGPLPVLRFGGRFRGAQVQIDSSANLPATGTLKTGTEDDFERLCQTLTKVEKRRI